MERKKQTISTLISISLLPRTTNNAALKEPEANRDEAARSLTLGSSSSVLNQWQNSHQNTLSCGINKSKSGEWWEERRERGWNEGGKNRGREKHRKGTEGTRGADGRIRDRRSDGGALQLTDGSLHTAGAGCMLRMLTRKPSDADACV